MAMVRINLREARPQFSLFGPGGRWASDPELAGPLPERGDSEGWAQQLLEGKTRPKPEETDAQRWAKILLGA